MYNYQGYHTNNVEIIDMNKHGDNSFKLNVDNIASNRVYVLYDIVNDIPRFERLKITKEKIEKERRSFNPLFLDNDFSPNYIFDNFYKDYVVTLNPTIIHRKMTLSYFQNRFRDEGLEIQSELFKSIAEFESNIISFGKQLLGSNEGVKVLLLQWGDINFTESMDPPTFGTELIAYKRISVITYKSRDFYRIVENDPYNF